MSRKNIENIYSLSPMQQGILFHALYGTHERAYLVELAWTLRGKLDTAALQRAWQDVVDRHTILRTAFAWERLERPIQVVRKRIPITIEVIDLREVPATDRADHADRAQRDLAKRGFDLTRAPLMRVALLLLDDEESRLVWLSHHLLLDGWSLPIVVREVFALYEAHASGRAIDLERPRPYGDYIAWLSKQDLAASEAFWRRSLEGFTAPTPLSVERADRGAEEGFEERTRILGEVESTTLQAFAREHKLTMSTLVQGAWALLLARYSGEEEVLYGSTVSGRSMPVAGIDRMVGLFINTLPIRVKVPRGGGLGALAWLTALQDQQAEIREHEHSPLVLVQGYSDLPRGVPLFESQVAFENYPSAETLREASAGLRVTETRMTSQAHYPLTFIAVSRRTLGLRVSYDKSRFDRPAIDRMLAHLATLLASIAHNPAKDVWELPIVPDDEARSLVLTWNDVEPAPSHDAAVHRLFEEQCDRTPDALALVAGGERLSYRELESRANRLAHHLRARGVGPDSVVGLCIDRSANLVVGLLGILKAGGAYVPLDPSHPPQRIAALCEESGASIVVTIDAYASFIGTQTVRFDGESLLLARESETRPDSSAGSASLAYVLFTSGSTGKPKGVAVEHRNLVNYVRGVSTRLRLPEGASYAHVSTFAADLGNTVLFPPLCLGGTLHVVPQELTTDPDGLGEYFLREGIDCLKIVPSHLAALLSGAHPERVIPRKLLVLGGEGSHWDLIERIQSLSPETRILNHYGPTETTVGVLTCPVERGPRVPGTAIVPLGKPLPGTRVYVLDRHLVPVPPGVAGEVFIGGACVARGYLGPPELSSARFLADPFRPGERMYRTGDRAKLLSTGELAFLGREDFQIKIRGYRIELGEIEAALLACNGVREAVVTVHDDGPEEKHLAAYVVQHQETPFDAAAIRAWLAARLPDVMIPRSVVALPALPLTPNGKIDRAALAAVEPKEVDDEDRYVAPQGPIEEVVASLWCDVFGKERIGVHDTFADLGGHSLIAIQIVARTREAFQIEIPLRAIFEAPTIAGLSREVEAALREADGAPPPPIERVPRDRPLQLSFAQERLWFLHQLEPESPYYNVASELSLRGRLDVGALERALHEIVRRHEVLRTTFASDGGRPVQVIHPEVDFRLTIVPLTELPKEAREAAIRRESAEEARRPFDLAADLLFRARLLVLGAEEHMLLLTLHHIVSDGWTRGILNRELGTLYRAFIGDEPAIDDGSRAGIARAKLPELPIQYADYAEWQRKWLSGDVLDRQIAYWKKQLDGAPHGMDLPTDRPRPPAQTYRGSNRLEILSNDVSKALEELARREGVTLYMTLLAALDVLLHRWTGQRDIVIGTSISNRNRAATEPLVGFFINALVLRTEVDDRIAFTELLQRVRATCLGAYAHQDMPFERLVQELGVAPDPSRAPLFQVIFTMQNAPGDAIALPGLDVKSARTDVATVKYDLTFLMGKGRDGRIGISIDYNIDLFDASTIVRMMGHLRNLLEAAAKDASRAIADLPMLAAGERQTLLVEWSGNDTAAPNSDDDCVHELFEAQADRTPEAVAVASGAARLTFRELDARANRLARYLKARGVGPESIVGLCVGRSVEMVVALLGVLKAGAAYLPLDPATPPHRLEEVLSDAGAKIAIADDRFASSLPNAITIVRLEGDAAAIARASGDRLDVETAPENLAYVIFTSGSTGRPKGVAIEHRNLTGYLRGLEARLDLPRDGRYAMVSTFSADLGNTVLFPPLCFGGTLHVIPEALTTDPAGLGAYFRDHGIDCLKIVPSHLSALLSGSHPERLIPSRLLILGGEASSWDLVERIHALSPETRIVNHYGPTETTVGVITHAVDLARHREAPVVPLGRPLPGARIYVLDAAMSPVPIGVPGEVYIGGAGVARGYIGRPDLTQERFVHDPFSASGLMPSRARLYRTGDRARYLPDGALVFLGRADAQVKIRGYRVELGEIESALAAHSEIEEAVVLAVDDSAGDRRLVAYVVPKTTDVARGALESFLAQRLPEYMIPSAFVVLEAFPLSPNGKIDRKALIALGRDQESTSAYAAPRTPIEEVLTSIWCDVFDRERIGVNERFSDLGGHSLLAIQIIARARDAFDAEVPLRALFEAPTIAALADRIEASIREGRGVVAPPLVRAPRTSSMPLSFAQERLWFLDQLDPGSASYNIPVRLRLSGELDVDALSRALQTIVDRHEVLRATFPTASGKPALVIRDHVDLGISPVTIDGDAAMHEAISAEAAAPFDLAAGPLVRVRLLRLSATEHILLVTMHHIVSDAWAKGVFYRELGVLYEAFRTRRPSPLNPLALQYADYAAWQRSWLSGDVLDRQVDYWRRTLAGAPAAIDLPTDRPRPPVLSARGGRRRFTLSPDLSKALRELARREGATLFMTLLAAFDTLLFRYTGQGDVVVGTPIAARTRAEIEPLIGFFVNTLVVRSRFEGETSFVDVLARVREACLGAYAHQDVPFERLVTDLAPERDLTRTPLFQVVFTFQEATSDVMRLPGLSISGVAAEAATAKFDLTLGMGEGPFGLLGSLEYSSDLYDSATIDRMIEHFRTLLEGIVAAPHEPVGALPILSTAERAALDTWSASKPIVPRHRTIHTWFEAAATRSPDAPAVTFEGRSISYRDLDVRANQLAHRLRRHGVGPDVMVGLCIERSAELIVAIVGILKAGGAYVPLDPDYPRDRLAFMVKDAGVPVIVTDASAAEKLPESRATVVVLDDSLAQESNERLPSEVVPENLAYVIYTSGSTGEPKGAMITHHNVTRLFEATEQWYGFGASDVWTMFHSYAFDFSVWEIWGALFFGGRVVVVPYWVSRAPEAFYRLLVDEGVTVLNQTPSAFRQLVHTEASMDARARDQLALRFVIFGGEALDLEDLRPFWARHGDARPALVNMYGITETTVHVTYRPLSMADLDRSWSSVIGRAIPDLSIRILDERRRPAPIGVAGEMYVVGAGVARGYLRRPELTQSRFLEDPPFPGERLYRTGDRARWLANGDIEYLGRVDHQVKIRGFRIELGEIEAALGGHPSIRECVVLARQDDPGEKRLVAYVVPANDAMDPTVNDLRSFVQKRLPDVMVPAAFVVLRALPLNENGKIDRRALPAPDEAERLDLGETFVAPQSPVEAELARIWASVLRLEKIGVHDNFFAVGGDSILSIQIVARAQAAGIRISPRQLFQHQTVAALAAVADEEPTSVAEQGPITGRVLLTPIQLRWLAEDQPQPNHHNQSFFLQARERLDTSAVERAIAAILAHHDALRLRVAKTASGWEQSFAEPGDTPAIARVDVLGMREGERGAAIEAAAAEAQASLDVASGPVFRAVLFEFGEGRGGEIFFVAHHLAIDAVSWRILVEDFWTAYTQASRGDRIVLPPKTTSFERWAAALAERTASSDLVAEAAYWLDRARSFVKAIPTDHDRGEATEASARSVVVSIATDETESLLRTVPDAYRTQINDVLLTALLRAVVPWAGAPSMLVDLEAHGREDVIAGLDLTRTVGWFTAIFPVLLELDQGAAVGDALKAVKEQLRRVPGRGLGYGLLRYLRSDDGIAAKLEALPQAEISFNYLGQLDAGTGDDAPYRRAARSGGPAHGPRNRRPYLLDVNASVREGRLGVRFTYSEHRHERATIDALASRFLEALRAILDHCVSPGAGGYTPSDFPRVELTPATLDAIAVHAGGRGSLEDIHPLSSMQEGILFHALYAADRSVYYVELAWTIEGNLDVAAFARAFQDVVDRHRALRTAVIWEGLDRPLARVSTAAALAVVEHDLRALGPDEQARAIDRFSADERRRGFDLGVAPLMRVALLRLGEDRWRFVWASHHIVLDGWSMPLVLKEVLQIYEARARGSEARLDRAPDHGAYLSWIAKRDPRRSEAFWRAQLGGFSAPTPMPGEIALSDRPRDARFDERRVRLSAEASDTLATFARARQITMSTLVQGAWAILLGRYAGEHDVLFGETVSGRSAPVPGIDRMIGLFINTLPVRVKIDLSMSSRAFLAALQDQQAELREHEQSALSDVQALSDVPRGTPLFESLVVFENQPVEESLKRGASGLSITAARSVERPPYPITLQASFRGTLLLRIGFDAARFDEALIDRVLGHLTTLLHAIVAAPESPVGALPILTQAERQRLVVTLNDTAFPHPEDALLHEVFAAQAARTPSAIALVFEGTVLTYGELDARANQLAHALRRRGVGPERLVGVCMERSIELIIALYGVLKAGGAYVPLDPEYPNERLAFMFDDAKPAVILTQAHLASVISGAVAASSSPSGADVLRVDVDWPEIAAEPTSAPDRGDLDLTSLAYVIYTSGSTGRPKGAMNAHRGILNRLFWMQHAYRLTSNDVVLQKTPFSFDVSVWEIFWPLMFGARLVVARPGGHREPGYLADLVASQGVTAMHFVPSMLNVFLDEAGASRTPSLRRVIASGEALSPSLVDRFFARFPGVDLQNLYGPTEAAVDVTSYACKPGDAVVPIGRPVHNTQIYVLDDRLAPVPEGIRGELYIGGVQVGRGYLNRPELTAERFVDDPFAPGHKLYRTGDLARWLASGDLEYLGRADFQIKVRGFRIEPGEIESALVAHPDVREAVVIARDDAGERRLVGYIACGARRPTASELRTFLGERLPNYMVPSAFVLLEALPLTASGKVDRRALPAPEEGERARAGASFATPTSAVEAELVRIWTSVLRVADIGVDDDFFEIGGDSILSIQIVSRAQRAGIHVTPRQIFEHPTIARLAAVAGTRRAIEAEQGLVTGAVPLTPIEHWWLEVPRDDAHHWNQSVFVEIRDAGEGVDEHAMRRAIARLLEHHDALRLRLARVEGALRQTIAPPHGEPPFRVVDVAGVVADDDARAAITKAAIEAHESLDLASGPIVRVVLFKMASGVSRLLVVAHHLAVDAVSWRIVLDDLWAAYTQAKRGLDIVLPAKTTSFKRWAEKLVDHARSPAVAAESAHWLATSPSLSARLPIDHRRGENDEASARTVTVSLSEHETDDLLRVVPDAYRTQINDVLLTALAQAFAVWTGASGALFDFEGHGREEIFDDVDVTRTVGWFTTVYPIGIELPSAGGLGAAIKSVKEQLRAVPNGGVGYGLLRYLGEGSIGADGARNSDAEVSFNYLGQVDQALPEDAPFRWAEGSSGPPRSPRARRRYLVDVNARIVHGRLHVWLSYSENRHRRETIEALAARFIDALRALIAHCLSPDARGFTPSDFEDADLSQDALDMLVGMVSDDEHDVRFGRPSSATEAAQAEGEGE